MQANSNDNSTIDITNEIQDDKNDKKNQNNNYMDDIQEIKKTDFKSMNIDDNSNDNE